MKKNNAAAIPPLTAPAPHLRKATTELSLPELAEEFRAVAALGCDYTISAGVCAKLYEAMTTPPAAPAPQESEGLSDERIRGIHREHWTYDEGTHFMSFARAIEREVAKAAPAAPVQTITEEMVTAAIEAFNDFPCPMNGSVARTGNHDHMRAALEGALLAAPVQAEQAQAEPVLTKQAFESLIRAWHAYTDGRLDPLGELLISEFPKYAALPAQAEQVAAVRAAALEEAAKTCDWHAEDANYGPAISTAKKCAAAIRALATKEAAAVEAPSQWISVDERLPEDCEDVLVLCPDTGCEPAIWSAKWLAGSKTFESNSNGWADLEDITHWMPRPAAPSQQSAQGDMGGDHA